MVSMLQPGRYGPEFVRVVGSEELATDERYDSTEKLMANAAEAAAIVAEILESRTLDEWVTAFEGMQGQWSVAQNAWEVGNDVSLRANGMIASLTDADGVQRELVTNPVQFDETPVTLTRAPQFAEHTDDIVRELGRTDEQLIELKIAGAIT